MVSMRSAALAAVVFTTLLACGDDTTSRPFGQPGGASSDGGSGGGGGGATSVGGSTSGGGGSGGTPIVCPTDPLTPGEHQMTISHDGNDRVYEVQVPMSYDNSTAVPLVLDIHGFTSNKDQQQLVSGFADVAEQQGFIVARPDGTGLLQSWNAGDSCCGDAQNQNLDDVGLMRAIVAEISAASCIDPRRVYATGISNGGALSHRLACEAADVFAAVAPVSYPIDFNPNSKCQPSRPIAVMHSHGTNDLLVPYNGGATSQPVVDSFAYWGTANNCAASPTETYSNGNSSCSTYATCDAAVNVSLCTVNGGHILYTNLDNVPIAELSWQFLQQFTLP
jgi:polyhydroxybutyrate depolymerase